MRQRKKVLLCSQILVLSLGMVMMPSQALAAESSSHEIDRADSGRGSYREEEVSSQILTPKVEVSVIPGETVSSSSRLEDSVSHRPAGDKDCSKIITTVEQQRTVTSTAGKATVTVGNGSENKTNLTPIVPKWTGEEQDITAARPDRFGQTEETAPAGYDFRYTGWGQDSHYGVYYTTIIPGEENSDDKILEDEGDVLQFLLTNMKDPEGPDHVAYCVDLCTSTDNGAWYRLDNLEEAGYYADKDAEDHIRAIVLHGYWGTAAGETGSLANMQEELLAAQKDGNTFLADVNISAMTAGEAQTATQMAIWQYGNRYEKDADLFLQASNYNGSPDWEIEEGDEQAWARINAVAAYLNSLSQTADDTTQIITQDKFIENMSLTVKDAVAEDTYNCDLSFSLVVTPGENDSLTVQVFQKGELLATTEILSGCTEYTIENIPLVENTATDFDLTITGTQYLEQGVYMYTAEGASDTPSQTMVGIAEGYKAVDMSMNITLTYEVEDAIITTKRIWCTVSDDPHEPTITPEAPTDPIPDTDIEEDPKEESEPEDGVAEDIPDSKEPIDYTVPDVPETGDDSCIWQLIICISAVMLFVLSLCKHRANS